MLGLRAASVAMTRLGVGRASDRELFAFVELGSDHYAQGFADGVQFATGCTFGKELIARLPQGKASVRLVDQVRGRAVRVALRSEPIAALERSDWFRACSVSGRFASACAALAGPVIADILERSDEALCSVGPVFPLRLVSPRPTFQSFQCEACGESVLASYARTVQGRRVCLACEPRCPPAAR